jgi:hypothetical protein
LERIVFSDEIREGWSDPRLWERVKSGEGFINPTTV